MHIHPAKHVRVIVIPFLFLCGLALASLYTVAQYIVFSFIFMILAGIGGFLYYHFTVTYPLKRTV